MLRASPTAKGNNPPASASHLRLVNAITARATMQIQTPRKNVLRNPMASVSDPTSKVIAVIRSDQAATRRSAFWSL